MRKMRAKTVSVLVAVMRPLNKTKVNVLAFAARMGSALSNVKDASDKSDGPNYICSLATVEIAAPDEILYSPVMQEALLGLLKGIMEPTDAHSMSIVHPPASRE